MLEDNPAMDLSIPSWDATEISTSLMDLLAGLCISTVHSIHVLITTKNVCILNSVG